MRHDISYEIAFIKEKSRKRKKNVLMWRFKKKTAIKKEKEKKQHDCQEKKHETLKNIEINKKWIKI